MKRVLIAFTFIFCMFGVIGYVNADTSKCDAQKKKENTNAVSSVNASYEFVYDDNGNVRGFDINVYNVPSNMSVLYDVKKRNEKLGDGIFVENGKGTVFDDNLTDIYTYDISLFALDDGCNYKVKTVSVTKPKKNEYSDSVYCLYDELKDTNYCQPWITKNINKSRSEVENILQSSLNKTTTIKATSKCVDCGAEGIVYNFKDIIKKYKYTFAFATVLAIILDIFAIVLLIKNGKGGVI